MPNRVLTKIHGSEKALNKIKEIAVVHEIVEEKDVEREDGSIYHQKYQEYDRFDFERVIPMPPHIYRGNLGKEQEEKYGKSNCWYEWSCRCRGTKRNASEYEDGGDYLSFETAWSCPIPIIRELSIFVPNEKFFIERADEAVGNGGDRFYIQNGKFEEVEKEKQLTEDEIRFAVWQNVPDDKCKLAREEFKKEWYKDEDVDEKKENLDEKLDDVLPF